MCLAVPGKLISISQEEKTEFKVGKVSFDGIIKEANLSMLPEAKVGDYVLVHVGIAISVVDEEEAMQTFKYLKEIGEIGDTMT